MKKVIAVFLLFSLPFTIYSQYKIKNFREGYTLRGKDTVKCKIFEGAAVNPYEQVVLKYTDSKFEEAITYFAGSIIKAYGYKKDTAVREFMSFFKKKFALLSNKYEDVFGLVIVKGRMTLLQHVELKYTGGTMGGTTREIVRYFLLRHDKDSAIHVLTLGLLEPGIDENQIREYFSDFPELVETIKKKTKLEDLIYYTKQYNMWFVDNKKSP